MTHSGATPADDPDSVRWWHHEWFRQLAAVPPALLGFLVPGNIVVKVLAFWDIFALVYLALTWLTYRRRDPAAVRALVLATRRRGLADRLFTSNPEQFAQSAAALALLTTAFVMPRAQSLGTSAALVIAVSIVAIISSWLTLQASFCITYAAAFADHRGLDFPGDEEPQMIDFLYFAVTIGTTFGTSDVTVTRRDLRRKVLTHSSLAFAFNTLILATAVGIIGSSVINA